MFQQNFYKVLKKNMVNRSYSTGKARTAGAYTCRRVKTLAVICQALSLLGFENPFEPKGSGDRIHVFMYPECFQVFTRTLTNRLKRYPIRTSSQDLAPVFANLCPQMNHNLGWGRDSRRYEPHTPAFLYQFQVRLRPSSKSTRGSYPSILRAKPMSA